MKRCLIFLLMFFLGFQSLIFAADPAPLYAGFPSVRESKAYKKFAVRTYSEFSKILYLIDRYSDSKILINYDDQTYTAMFCTTVARWFLSRNYKKQTAREWINQWCHKSIVYSKPIYVKLPDGKFRPSREILLEELESLERVVKENRSGNGTAAAPDTAAVAAVPAVSAAGTAVPAPAPAAKTEMTASANVSITVPPQTKA